MTLNIPCDRCGTELTEPGGLLFTPPFQGLTTKIHICVKCWPTIIDATANVRADTVELTWRDCGDEVDLNNLDFCMVCQTAHD